MLLFSTLPAICISHITTWSIPSDLKWVTPINVDDVMAIGIHFLAYGSLLLSHRYWGIRRPLNISQNDKHQLIKYLPSSREVRQRCVASKHG